jgi:hypothetical protein
MAGKGSKPRPLAVPKDEFDKSFENIFGKKPPKEPWVPPTMPETLDDKKDTNK